MSIIHFLNNRLKSFILEPENYLTRYTTGGPHNVSEGEWTDDTRMALALASSLIEQQEFDAEDVMNKFCQWFQHGKFCTRDQYFDIG